MVTPQHKWRLISNICNPRNISLPKKLMRRFKHTRADMVTSMLNALFVGKESEKPGGSKKYLCPYCVKDINIDGEITKREMNHAGGVACFLDRASRKVIPLVL
jgi:hypothetical protein